MLVDTKKGKLISDEEIKLHYANAKPYDKWLKNMVHLEEVSSKGYKHNFLDEKEILCLQRVFAWNYDELKLSVEAMASNGKEILAAMGVDTPLAVLSESYQPLFNYFKQLFAQVTNPPLDAIREEIITSTRVYLGSEGNLLKPNANNCKRVELHYPIISNEELYKIRNLKNFKVKEFSILFEDDKKTLEEALEELFKNVENEIEKGASIIILSDIGVNEEKCYIPSFIAVAGLHNHLIKKKT